MVKNNCFLISKTYYSLSTSLNVTFFHYSTSSTSSKQGLNIDNTIHDLEAINWFSLNKNGSIIVLMTKELEKKPGVYIYFYILDKNKIYIGSSVNVAKRLIDHKNSFNKSLKICPKFYNCVNKYGWNNFRVGVLEYLDFKIQINLVNKALLRKGLLEREQFYFDILNPTLNVNKIAGSSLGFRHSEETRNNLSLRARHGVIVKALDKDNNVVNTFPTIASTADE